MTEESVNFKTSKLGTKDYWDKFYKLEQNNFDENEDDTGECWFNESDAENKMCDFIFEKLEHIQKTKVCDLGTGNGHLLFQLYEDGLRGNLIGVDYSETSVEFAKKVAEKKGYEVTFERSDILRSDDQFLAQNIEAFDLVLDKGTLDAIALSDETYEGGLTGFQTYPKNIVKLIKKRGILLITSCNFTQEEICKHFTSSGDFKIFGNVDYPVIEFGGVKGSTICTVAFEKI